MQHGDGSGGRHAEDRAVAVRAATVGRAVEVAVLPQDQGSIGMRPVGVGDEAEARQIAERTVGCDFEKRAAVVDATEAGHPVEVAGRILDQGTVR